VFLGMQDFSFYPSLIKFTETLPSLSIFDQIFPTYHNFIQIRQDFT